jgi:cysteine-rich repeat protein
MKNLIRMIFYFVLSVGLFVVPAAADEMTQFTTVFDTDVASFGFGGIRTLGTGTITVSGVTGTVTQAILYWQGPTDSTNPLANAAVNFNGTDINGTNIGFSSDNCWGFTNSQGYRADVTSLVTGDGVYTLSNFIKADAEINGVGLIVFFDDGVSSNNRDVVVFEGNDSNQVNAFDSDGWNAFMPGINYSSGTVNMLLIVADGQIFDDNGIDINGNTIIPPGFNFQGDTVPNGPSAVSTDGGLWDHISNDITSILTPGNNDLTLTSIGASSDCLGLVSIAFDLPAGAAPPVGICGDGILDPGEQCDDGNTINGDGCSSTCQIEAAGGVAVVPTMTEWGMIIFVVFAGLGSIYYLRRKRVEG